MHLDFQQHRKCISLYVEGRFWKRVNECLCLSSSVGEGEIFKGVSYTYSTCCVKCKVVFIGKTASCMTAQMVHVSCQSVKWWSSYVSAGNMRWLMGHITTQSRISQHSLRRKAQIYLIYTFIETEATTWTIYKSTKTEESWKWSSYFKGYWCLRTVGHMQHVNPVNGTHSTMNFEPVLVGHQPIFFWEWVFRCPKSWRQWFILFRARSWTDIWDTLLTSDRLNIFSTCWSKHFRHFDRSLFIVSSIICPQHAFYYPLNFDLWLLLLNTPF